MRFTYTPQMQAWMRAYYLLPAGQLAIAFNHRFGTDRTAKHVHAYRKTLGLRTGRTGCFEKGHVPDNKGTKGLSKPNSGSFRKGNVPANHKPVGSERVNVDGYVEIKVAEPSKWRLKHRIVWEEVNGPLPPGACITFKDSNPLNCDYDNLELITQAENAVFNKHFQNVPPELKPVARAVVKLKMKARERISNGKSHARP